MVASVQSSTVAGRNETLPERKLSRPTRLGGSSSGRSAWRGVGTSTSNRAGVTKRARRTDDLLEAGRPTIRSSRPGAKSARKRPLGNVYTSDRGAGGRGGGRVVQRFLSVRAAPWAAESR